MPTIIESLRMRGHLPRRDLVTVNAWDRAKEVLVTVTADDVKVAWERLRLARNGVALGADSELFDFRMADFKHKLERWLNG